jgi:hypothetical protein
MVSYVEKEKEKEKEKRSNEELRALITNSPLKINTIKSYLANLNTIQKYTKSDSLHEIIYHPGKYYPLIEQGAKDGRRVIREGRDTDGTVRTLVKTILALIKQIKSSSDDDAVHKEWYARFADKTKALIEKADNNVPLSHNMTWMQIRQQLSKWPIGSIEHVVLSLYVEIPPRRQQDYWKLYLCPPNKEKPEKSVDYTSYMTGTKGTKGTLGKLVVSVYKTADKYDEWSKDIPVSLLTTIQIFIANRMNQTEKKSSQYLFAKKDGQPYASLSSFTDANNTVIKRALNNPHASVNTLRHAAATMVATSPDMLRREKKEWASDMGHSLSMQEQYVIATDRTTKPAGSRMK